MRRQAKQHGQSTGHDHQRHHVEARASNAGQRGAFGPWLVTRDEIADDQELSLFTRLNGVEMQRATTNMMIFAMPRLIAYLSSFATLVAGDVIFTGTPGGVGFKRSPPVFMKHGDVVEIEVEKIGILSNRIVRASESGAALLDFSAP